MPDMFSWQPELLSDPDSIARGEQLIEALQAYRQDHYSEELQCFEPSVPIEAPNLVGMIAAFVGENQLTLGTVEDLEPDLFRQLGTDLTRDMLLYMTAERARRAREDAHPARKLMRTFMGRPLAAASLVGKDAAILRSSGAHNRSNFVRYASGVLIKGKIGDSFGLAVDGRRTHWTIRPLGPDGEPLVQLAIGESRQAA